MVHLQILSAGSTLHGLQDCVRLAAQILGVEIAAATDHGHNIREAVKRGDAQADVVLLPTDMAEALGVHLGERIALGTVGIGGVVRQGTNLIERVPDISTMDKLRAALIEADAVLLTHAPTGAHLLAVIGQLGLADKIATKLSRYDTSTKLNLALAARSDHALGFGPETEIRACNSVRWIGDVPDDIQIALPYAAAMVAKTRLPHEARAFLDFLKTPLARAAFAKTGVRFTTA